MNYYIINNTSWATAYGIGTYVKQLTAILLKLPDIRLFHIDLYSEEKEFSIVKDELGVTHYRVPVVRSQRETEMYCRTVACLLDTYIHKEETEIYHFNYFQHYPLALALKTKNIHSRIFLTVHYLNWCFELNGNVRQFREIIYNKDGNERHRTIKYEHFSNRSFLRLADSVIVLSEFCKNILHTDYKIGLDKLHLIYNGLDDMGKGTPPLSTSSPIILFVGRLDKAKGVNYLIEAFRQVLNTHEDARLILVGDGNYNECLKSCKGLWEKVVFTGKIDREELFGLYRRATIGVLPSFNEQCSYSAIEFMMHGIPFVATDSTGLSEMLDVAPELRVHIDEDNFSESEFVEELAARMNLLLDNRETRERVATLMYEQYTRLFSRNVMLRKMSRLIENSTTGNEEIISGEFLTVIDDNILNLLHQEPDIDNVFYGIAGIGIYLWWRVSRMDELTNEAFVYKVKEYLIYYLDWLYRVVSEDTSQRNCSEMAFTLRSMQESKYYQVRVDQLIEVMNCPPIQEAAKMAPDDTEIVYNALRMINTKI